MPPDVRQRDTLVAQLKATLADSAPGASVALRGSLADSRSDPYSDIDLSLTVDGVDFERCLNSLLGTLQTVRPVRLLRVDPETAALPDRRLVFVLFSDVPLFWRLDLEVVAVPVPDRATSALGDLGWSLTASALMNALAAVKALARSQDERAVDLLVRGFAQIDVEPSGGHPAEAAIALVTACANKEPGISDIADEVSLLAQTIREERGFPP